MFDDCWLFGDNGIFCFDISTCLSSNWRQFLFNYRLAFSFFFILVLPLPLIFLRVTHSKVVLHLFISFLSNLRVRFLRDVHTPHSFPPLFVIVFLSLIYLPSSVSFSLCYSYSFVSFIYMSRVSRSQLYSYLANEADIFERKNLCQKSSVAIVELDRPSKMYFFFMEYVAN